MDKTAEDFALAALPALIAAAEDPCNLTKGEWELICDVAWYTGSLMVARSTIPTGIKTR